MPAQSSLAVVKDHQLVAVKETESASRSVLQNAEEPSNRQQLMQEAMLVADQQQLKQNGRPQTVHNARVNQEPR